MRAKELLYVLVFLFVLVAAVGCSSSETSEDATTTTNEEVTTEATPQSVTAVEVPQLDADGREDSATMVLLDTPPMMPDDHGNYWNSEIRQESCLVCHNAPETGAMYPTADHYYNEEQGGEIFRDTCIQCHATQNDSKPAFNLE